MAGPGDGGYRGVCLLIVLQRFNLNRTLMDLGEAIRVELGTGSHFQSFKSSPQLGDNDRFYRGAVQFAGGLGLFWI